MSSFKVNPIAGVLGAEIDGIDLSQPLAAEVFDELVQVHGQYGVIFFRDQHLTPEQYIGFAERFGEIRTSKVLPVLKEYPKIAHLVKEPAQKSIVGDIWHTDQIYRQDPVTGTMLYAREIPPYGGDTQFRDAAAIFDALSPGLQKTLEGLRSVHAQAHLLNQATAANNYGSERETDMSKGNAVAVHPAVITHPVSGRKVLNVNPGYTTHFEGWTRAESLPILEYLFQVGQRPEFTCRFRWQVNSLGFWDNRRVWHYANNDFHGHRREMYRITVV
ncbi:TauD/TfdA family dioxygenase [Paraburkholderia phymatum]|uniref:TauD/TfdA dioxygenase family protein n=1 Tax=Paraburkholderia phymatum TaxID=148447 RepID=UPI0031753180